jgi:DNA-binding NtrC family response regulator
MLTAMPPMPKPKMLVISEDEALCQNLEKYLCHRGFDFVVAPHEADALPFYQSKKPDLLIISSHRENPDDGLGVVESIRKLDTRIPIILISRYSSEERIIAAFRAYINDYLKSPLSLEELLKSIKRNLFENPYLPAGRPGPAVAFPKGDHSLVGDSTPIREIRDYLSKVAATSSSVLITGETGTGKELAAESIHRKSVRNGKPFVCINCAALPESLIESEMFGYERGAFTGAVALSRGKFEQAQSGTVFLDEIGDMSSYAQAKILRTIERKEVRRLGGKRIIPLDIRVTAATNRDPEQLVEEGKFREDLYYRLNVGRVHMPPLRDHKEDIPALIDHTVRKLNRRFGRKIEGLTDEALTCLLDYDWPGNVRELINILEAAFINLPSPTVTVLDLPETFHKRLKEAKHLPKSERDQVLSALFDTKWNKSKAARRLHWSRMTLYRKMVKYDIVSRPPSAQHDAVRSVS